MVKIHTFVKLLVLFAGLVSPTIGTALLLVDGIFHATVPHDKLAKESPDWIISKHLWNKQGLSETIHKIMGLILVALSLYYIMYHKKSSKRRLILAFKDLLIPVTLIIITIAVIIKGIKLGDEYGKVAFM